MLHETSFYRFKPSLRSPCTIWVFVNPLSHFNSVNQIWFPSSGFNTVRMAVRPVRWLPPRSNGLYRWLATVSSLANLPIPQGKSKLYTSERDIAAFTVYLSASNMINLSQTHPCFSLYRGRCFSSTDTAAFFINTEDIRVTSTARDNRLPSRTRIPSHILVETVRQDEAQLPSCHCWRGCSCSRCI